jgi:hypothetical protein
MENSDYPELKSVSLDAYFQEELVTLYFYSVRSCPENLALLEKRLCQVLQMLESNFEECDQYIDLFYKLVLYIRKTGEHDLTYMMIWTWYHYFPCLAKQLVKECLSWRDVVYFCHYVSCHMKDNKTLGEAIIEHCVRLINKQFISDMEIWRFSIHAGEINHISNVAKWIPRENKRFSWLYELLVLDWIRKACPYLLQTTTRSYSYEAAILKGKRLYRKKVATLNKALQTVQIKQCSGQLSDIFPNMISKYTAMKQPKLRDKQSLTVHETKTSTVVNQAVSLPIAYYIKEAIQGSQTMHEQWAEFIKRNALSRTGQNIIPILDISNKIQFESLESYYSAIGLALFIAEQTASMRILAIGENPIWIKICPSMSFEQRVLYIHEKCGHYQGSQIDRFIALVQQYVKDVQHCREQKPKSGQNELPTFLILSDFSVPTFHRFHEKVSCNIIYWNLSSKHRIENLDQMLLPCSIEQNGVTFLSGFSISPIFFDSFESPYTMIKTLVESE